MPFQAGEVVPADRPRRYAGKPPAAPTVLLAIVSSIARVISRANTMRAGVRTGHRRWQPLARDANGGGLRQGLKVVLARQLVAVWGFRDPRQPLRGKLKSDASSQERCTPLQVRTQMRTESAYPQSAYPPARGTHPGAYRPEVTASAGVRTPVRTSLNPQLPQKTAISLATYAAPTPGTQRGVRTPSLARRHGRARQWLPRRPLVGAPMSLRRSKGCRGRDAAQAAPRCHPPNPGGLAGQSLLDWLGAPQTQKAP
jgi:hypothetical protein